MYFLCYPLVLRNKYTDEITYIHTPDLRGDIINLQMDAMDITWILMAPSSKRGYDNFRHIHSMSTYFLILVHMAVFSELSAGCLRWFKTESPNWLTEDQMKQAFLKRFNPWGDTRCQQQDAWNKLKFDMTKDDVDAFVVDMKMLASILGHNDHVITKKFKDIFPDPNIEAALIAMDNFVAMQTKTKQLVQIYKPAHDSPMASAAILVHTVGNTPTKSKSSQPKSNQHQLAPINQPQDNPNTGETEYNGGQCGRGRGCNRNSCGCGNRGNSDNQYDNQDRGTGHSQEQRDFQYNRGQGQENSFQGR